MKNSVITVDLQDGDSRWGVLGLGIPAVEIVPNQERFQGWKRSNVMESNFTNLIFSALNI
jgi:hypothetical protein